MKHRFALLFLGGCSFLLGKGPHVPSDYQGTTEITVANAWDHPLCVFSLSEQADARLDNWLGDRSKQQTVAPGARRTFAIKPGVYHVIGGYCDGGQALAAAGTYGAATTEIKGPTLIALGPNHVDPVAGVDTRAFPKLYYAQADAGGGGGEAPAAEEPAAESAPATAASSSSSEPAAPAGPQCLPHGAVCADGPACCGGMKCASRTKFSDGSLGNGYCE